MNDSNSEKPVQEKHCAKCKTYGDERFYRGICRDSKCNCHMTMCDACEKCIAEWLAQGAKAERTHIEETVERLRECMVDLVGLATCDALLAVIRGE